MMTGRRMFGRKFALDHGAALVYVGKDGRNVEPLYRYLVHRAHNKEFTHEASIGERDYVFVPAGWDNASKLALVSEGMQFDASTRYEDIVQAPTNRNVCALLSVLAVTPRRQRRSWT